MHFNTKVVVAFLVAAMAPSTFARINGPCSGDYKGKGVCVSTASCNSASGSYISGFCPGDPANIKCCVKRVQVGNRVGTCLPITQCLLKEKISGYCPGDSTVKLCMN